MSISNIVKEVGQKFQYKSDPRFLDYWSVMKEDDGKLIGDCDDFALTSIWRLCGENIIIFILNVMILHRYRIYFAKTVTGEKHAVGYANGMYFDNWTREALPKDQFLARTRHKLYFFFPSPFMVLPLVFGFILRLIRN